MSHNKKESIEKGKLFQLQKGRWVSEAPFGYKAIRRDIYERGIPKLIDIVIDEKTSGIVEDIFNLYSTENYSRKELINIIKDKYDISNLGLGTLHYILKNKFYIGIMVYKGKEYPHNYKTFISKEIFEKCEYVSFANYNKLKKRPHTSSIICKSQLHRLEMGRWIANFPYGYKFIPQKRTSKFNQEGKVEIDPVKSNIVKTIFSEFSKGSISLKLLKNKLVEIFPNEKFNRSSLHRVLSNKFYIGIMTARGKEYPHIYPTFVTPEEFERVQEILANNRKHKLHIPSVTKKESIDISSQEQEVLSLLKHPYDIEGLSLQCKFSLKELMQLLSSLEQKRIILKNSHNEYYQVDQ